MLLSRSGVSDSLRPHRRQHAGSSPTPSSLHKLMFRVSGAIQLAVLSRPLLFLLSVFPSIRVFSNEPALQLWITYKLLHIKQVTDKNLLWGRGNSTRYSVMTYKKESKGVDMCMYN